jgi:hypothetical protein
MNDDFEIWWQKTYHNCFIDLPTENTFKDVARAAFEAGEDYIDFCEVDLDYPMTDQPVAHIFY